MGRCPACEGWGTMGEHRPADAGAGGDGAAVGPLADVPACGAEHRATGIAELDRVLGGGLVGGGAYLVAGEPGIG